MNNQKTDRTAEQIETEILEISRQIERLKTRQGDIEKGIADHWYDDTAELEQEHAGIDARVKAGAILIERLKRTVPAAVHRAELDQLTDLAVAERQAYLDRAMLTPLTGKLDQLMEEVRRLSLQAEDRERNSIVQIAATEQHLRSHLTADQVHGVIVKARAEAKQVLPG